MSALARLNPRERVLVLGVLPLAALAAGWWLAWVPLAEGRAARESEIAAYRVLAEAARGAGDAPLAAATAPRDPLSARVTEAAEAAGLALSRIEPEGEALRVAVGEAPFATVLLWLADLEEERQVLLSAVEIDRRTVPGAVSARILLQDAP